MIEMPGYLHVVVHLSSRLFGRGLLDHAAGELLLSGTCSNSILADAIEWAVGVCPGSWTKYNFILSIPCEMSIGKDHPNHPREWKPAMFLGLKPGFPVIVKYSFDLQSLDVSKRVEQGDSMKWETVEWASLGAGVLLSF